MTVVVVGSGKLANEILTTLQGPGIPQVASWAERTRYDQKDTVVVHAGSGRELTSVYEYCKQNGNPLIELATNTHIDMDHHDFPLVVCPNTNILMLKFMAMLSRSGDMFLNYRKTILESHQSAKTSEPGTAYDIAQSLHVEKDQVESVRDPVYQEKVLGIPHEYLERHAYHRVSIGDANTSLTFETRVLGPAPYSVGLAEIIGAVAKRKLENRVYNVLEFIEAGWI